MFVCKIYLPREREKKTTHTNQYIKVKYTQNVFVCWFSPGVVKDEFTITEPKLLHDIQKYKQNNVKTMKEK